MQHERNGVVNAVFDRIWVHSIMVAGVTSLFECRAIEHYEKFNTGVTGQLKLSILFFRFTRFYLLSVIIIDV